MLPCYHGFSDSDPQDYHCHHDLDHHDCDYKELPDSPSASRCVGFLWHHRLTATRMLVTMMMEKIRMVMAIFMMVIKVLKNDVGKGLKYLHMMKKGGVYQDDDGGPPLVVVVKYKEDTEQ